jgi:hypothetical protein
MDNKEIHNLFSKLNVIRMIKLKKGEMNRACIMHMKNAFSILARTSKENRPLGKIG